MLIDIHNFLVRKKDEMPERLRIIMIDIVDFSEGIMWQMGSGADSESALSEPPYCIEPHEKPVATTHQHPKVSREHPLCEDCYNEACEFAIDKMDRLARDFDRSFER